MSYIAGLLAALQAIPQILGMVKSLFDYLNHATGGDISGYIRDSSKAIEELKAAKTPEQKLDAAKKIQNLIAKL